MVISIGNFGVDPVAGTVVEYAAPNVIRLDDPDISAAEQPTGRHWIDGRMIYQRTIQTGPLAGGETAPHNIPNIAMVVGIGGISWGPNVAAGVGTTQA